MSASQQLAIGIGRNTLFGIAATGTQVGTRLITVPIVVAHLGIDGYGIWSLIMTIAAHMRFGTAGLKSAYQIYVAGAIGNGDFEAASRLLSTGSAMMAALSPCLFFVALFSESLAAALGVPASFQHSSAQAIAVLGSVFMISNVGRVFEAILLGAQRMDIARTLTSAFVILEALGIALVVSINYGLLAMACVMAGSELGFLVCSAAIARRVVPQVRLAPKYVSRTVIPELVRFAGSYQLVNVLELLYSAILPVAILKTFGATAAGVYAIAMRLSNSAQAVPDALLPPVLSGSATAYAARSAEETRGLLLKSFKATLGFSLFPLAFLAAFGPTVVLAWTGQGQPLFRTVLPAVSVAALFESLSRLQQVLYRSAGKALLDNGRQLLRLSIVLTAGVTAEHIGLTGLLAGLAAAEMSGLILMFYAIKRTFRDFALKPLATDALRMGAAVAAVLTAAAVWFCIPFQTPDARLAAAVRTAIVSFAFVLTVGPALYLTKAVTGAEGQVLMAVLLPWRRH